MALRAASGARLILLLLIGVAAAAPLAAQELPPADTLGEEDRGRPAEAVREGEPPVSPLGALGRSFVLPGWGQLAVDRPGRAAIYFVAEAASLFMVFKTQARLDAAERGASSLPPGQEDPLVESRKSQREDWIVLSAFVALMSGVDAWIGAHLYDFEGELVPPEDGSAGVELRYSVPLDLP